MSREIQDFTADIREITDECSKLCEKALLEHRDQVEKLGSCTSRTFYFRDVTDGYSDLAARYKNLSRLHERLSELLKTAVKVEDILKIETELARVTGDMERLKGKINVMQNKISMLEINIEFSVSFSDNLSAEFPMSLFWLHKIGIPHLEMMSESREFDKFQVKLVPPNGFVSLCAGETFFRAMDSHDTVLRAEIHDNLPGGGMDCYKTLLQRQFKITGYEKISLQGIQLAKNVKGFVITAERGQESCYLLIAFYEVGWFSKKQKIFLAEFIGKTLHMKGVDIKALAKSLEF